MHESADYGWMWRDYIQKNLLINLNAILEDTKYLDDDSTFVDLDDDGNPDSNPSPSLSNTSGEILEPYIKTMETIKSKRQ